MKRKQLHIIMVMLLTLCLLCTACGGTTGSAGSGGITGSSRNIENIGSAGESISPQDDPNEGLGGDFNEDAVNDFSEFAGIWLGEPDNFYDSLEIDGEGNWTLYRGGGVEDTGYLRYEPEYEAVYAYSNLDDAGVPIALEDSGQLHMTTIGYFNYGDGMEYLWYEDGGGDHDGDQPEDDYRLTEDDEPYSGSSGNGFYSWNSELYQRNVSEFEGIWYYDGDLTAETYIVIDDAGNWSYYQRAPGTEAAEMDCGIFSYSTDEASVYYADSLMYDGVSYRVFEFDDDVLIWGDEGAYYLME